MSMYRIEIFDRSGRRIHVCEETPLLEVTRRSADEVDTIRGLLSRPVPQLNPGCRVRVLLDNVLFCEAELVRVNPQWGDTRRLILDRYVAFHDVVEIEAERSKASVNTLFAGAFSNRSIGAMVRSIIQSVPGPVHYKVARKNPGDGGTWEYAKFIARKTPENELELGGISSGQWVGANRIDSSGAYAKDGDTISGLVVDGAPWPDLRLIMIDSEELTRNPHAVLRHPEVATWTDDEYAASGYKVAAERSQQSLQDLVSQAGISFIELNPHRDYNGAFDYRVDMYGRYVGLVFGGGSCMNAAQVERGYADVYQWEDGKFHAPELELKDFFSYQGNQDASIADTTVTLSAADFRGGVLDLVALLAYGAGCTWSLEADYSIRFRPVQGPDRVAYYDSVKTAMSLGVDARGLVNGLYFSGNPLSGGFTKTYRRDESIDAYGFSGADFDCFCVSTESDANKVATGILDDLSFPEFCGSAQFYHGNSSLRVGDLLELRGENLARIDTPLPGEWGDRFIGRIIGRVKEIRHRFMGKVMTTAAYLTSPCRCVARPLSFMTQNQGPADSLYQFRLDEATVGLDMGYHLD